MTFSFFSLISQIFQFFYPEFFQSFGLVDEYLCTRHCMVRRWKLEKRRLWRNHRVAKEGKWASGKLPGSRITTQAPGEDCQWISWWLCKTSASTSFILAWAFFSLVVMHSPLLLNLILVLGHKHKINQYFSYQHKNHHWPKAKFSQIS